VAASASAASENPVVLMVEVQVGDEKRVAVFWLYRARILCTRRVDAFAADYIVMQARDSVRTLGEKIGQEWA